MQEILVDQCLDIKWEIQANNEWVRFGTEEHVQIERAFERKFREISIAFRGETYRLDLTAYVAVCYGFLRNKTLGIRRLNVYEESVKHSMSGTKANDLVTKLHEYVTNILYSTCC